MSGAKFDISESDAAAKYLQKGFEVAAKKALLSSAMRIVQIITTEIIPKEPRPPVDTSAYRAGWRAKSIPKGAEISNSLPYAAIIEYGAKSENIKVGRKMIDALTAWVKRKGLAKGTDARSVAFAIANAMKKKGIYNGGKGLGILRKGMHRLPKVLAEEYAREMKKMNT